MATLGEKISALRYERGLTVEGLAHDAGVGRTTIVRLERGGTLHGDNMRAVIGALHRSAPLSERDVFDLAHGSKLSEGAIIAYLQRISPVEPHVPESAKPLEAERARLHAVVDRMLARAPARDIELALHAMLAAFEAQLPEGPTTPLLTRRGEPRTVAPGVSERTDRHYQTGTDR